MRSHIIRKLTSRKFWLALAAFVSGLIVAFGGEDAVADTVSGCMMAGASVVAYIIGEGFADGAAATSEKENDNGGNI